MAKKKDNRWNDIDGGHAFLIPVSLLRHPNFTRLSPYALKLIMDLARQYSGFNNGYLCASWALMKDAGWNSSHTLRKATLEAEHYKLIVRTQQGGLNKPNLHGFTWRRIDERKEKHLEVRPTMTPSDAWKIEQSLFVMPAPKPRRKRREQARKAA